jgi:uncharacterized protein (DUF983 family)
MIELEKTAPKRPADAATTQGGAVDESGPRVAPRPIRTSIWRGIKHLCPACGDGALYSSYLKVSDTCPSCSEELHHQRADDAPPYITIFIVGHIVIPALLLLEQTYSPPTWVHMSIWLPLIVVLSLLILPRVKGAFVGLQWALRMHGFDPNDTTDDIYTAALEAEPQRR